MRTKTEKQRLLRELKDSGIVEKACRKTGIPRSDFYRWYKSDSAFRTDAIAAQEIGRSKMNDYVESKLLESINNGSVQGMRFWLIHNSKIYNTVSAEEVKRLRYYEGLVFELLDVAVREDDMAVLRIIRALRDQEKQRIEKENGLPGI